jgi:hypothetical protein
VTRERPEDRSGQPSQPGLSLLENLLGLVGHLHLLGQQHLPHQPLLVSLVDPEGQLRQPLLETLVSQGNLEILASLVGQQALVGQRGLEVLVGQTFAP